MAYAWPDYLTSFQARLIEAYRFGDVETIEEQFARDRERKTQEAIARLKRVRDPATSLTPGAQTST